jgi:hypothetical protein
VAEEPTLPTAVDISRALAQASSLATLPLLVDVGFEVVDRFKSKWGFLRNLIDVLVRPMPPFLVTNSSL